jgi:hypothetical protein
MDDQARLQREIIGPGLRAYYAFITPPFFAALFAPLALLPYGLAFALWSLGGLAALWASIRLMGLRPSRRSSGPSPGSPFSPPSVTGRTVCPACSCWRWPTGSGGTDGPGPPGWRWPR